MGALVALGKGSFPIWQREVEAAIDLKNKGASNDAVGHIARIGGLTFAADSGDKVPSYTAGWRLKYRPKRNLMKLLAERHW